MGRRFTREPPGRGNGRLDHGTGRDSQGPKPGAIELGNEPPLSVDGGLRKDFDRRRVSVRWLSGTILTGLCGAALMGGAVFAALDGEAHFAANPERVEPSRGALGGRATARKSDRLPPIVETNSARHIIRVTTMTRIGEREVPRVRPFVKVSSNLALAATELSAKIPPFNPQRLLANMGDDETPAAEEAAGAAPDAEVSFVTRDLLSAMPRLKLAAAVPLDDVLSKVRDAANYTGSVPPKFALASINPGKLAYASPDAPVDPYAGFEARIVPENITMLAKTAPQATGGNSLERAQHRDEERRNAERDPARSRGHARGDQGDRRGARPARPRRQSQGRPEDPRAAVAGPRHPAPAAGAGHAGRRDRDRGGGRAVRSRQICRRRRPERGDPGRGGGRRGRG